MAHVSNALHEDGAGRDAETVSYVILCHSNPAQVLRLARTIHATSPRANVLIRHDQPPGFLDAPDAEACGADLLVSDLQCRWGHWSLVEATLEAFQRVRQLHDPDWIVLISGQDYPIKPLGAWETTLLCGEYDAVMQGEPLVEGPSRLTPGSNRQRLRLRYTHRWYWLPRLNLIPRLPRLLTESVRRFWFKCVYPLQALVVLHQLPRNEGWVLGLRRRRVPWSRATPVYKGSQWMAVSRRALDTVVDGPDAVRLREYFQRTLVPDEAYFQTILANARELRVGREPISWLRWESDETPHPDVIDERTLELASHSGTPFARKFDASRTPGILDRIDRMVLFETASR